MAQQVVDRREIEIHLAGELGLERNGLQIDDHVAAQLEVIEEQVDAKFFASDRQRILAADECEADSQFEQELP